MPRQPSPAAAGLGNAPAAHRRCSRQCRGMFSSASRGAVPGGGAAPATPVRISPRTKLVRRIRSLFIFVKHPCSNVQVTAGVELVAEAGRTLQHIAAEVTEIKSVVAEIVAGAQEQATALREINSAIERMSSFTQQNAAMVEESTATGQSLTEQTTRLAELVGQFRLGRQASDGGIGVEPPPSRALRKRRAAA